MNTTPTARDMIELPDNYLFKIIFRGPTGNQVILDVVNNHLGRPIGKHTLTSRPSGKGNYISFSLTLWIEKYEEIEALYLAFQALDDVVMVM